MALQAALRSVSFVLRESSSLSRLTGTYPALPSSIAPCVSSVIVRPRNITGGQSSAAQSVRHYARAARTKRQVIQSHLSDLPPTMLKMDYAAVPLAQNVDDVVKRLLTLELANHSEKLRLKEEQLIAKVQKDEADRHSVEVKVAILTTRIRNYQEHLQKHPKDKANKRRMLMSIDSRNKFLKNLRRTHYESFENVCEQLGITYTFPPQYYRRTTRRWLAKKAFCLKVYKEVQKQKAAQRFKLKEAEAPKEAAESTTSAAQ